MKIKVPISTHDFINCSILTLLIGLFFLPTLNLALSSDSSAYVQVAQTLLETHQLIRMPHFLFPVMVIIVKIVLGTNYWRAAKLVHLFFQVILGLVLYFIINKGNWGKSFFKSSLLQILVPFSLLIIAPVFLLAPYDHHLYFGYIGITVYHNATMAVLKPLALLLLIFMSVYLHSDKPATPVQIVGVGILTVLTTLAKPSFTIAFLPALGLILAVLFFKKKMDTWSAWKAPVFGLFLPASLVLIWQFFYTYIENANRGVDASIVFAPLLVLKLWTSGWLLPKFFLSILFPLGSFLIYLPSSRKEIRLLLAWLTFFIGASYGYLFAETVCPNCGNFMWSGQIGLFILFVCTLIFVLEQYQKESALPPRGSIKPKTKISIVFSLYLLQVISGIFWYVIHLDVLGNYINWF